MAELQSILILAAALALALNLFPRLRCARIPLFAGASLLFIYWQVSPLYGAVLLLWTAGVYGLATLIVRGRLNGKTAAVLYILAVSSLFLALRLGISPHAETGLLGEVFIPLGFSFVMFQSIDFLLKAARAPRTPLPSFTTYCAAAWYFPTLIMGPFNTVADQRSQLEKTGHNPWDIFWGYSLIALGLFKFGISSILLDSRFLGAIPMSPAGRTDLHPLVKFLLASVYFYANFSGFFDMVRGSSQMLGVDLPVNFRFPFLSASMAEFWRHWHISLGQWFREHVFFPLSFRLSKTRTKFSERFAAPAAGLVTFLLIGAWHGIGGKFLLWSVLNGLLVVFVTFGARHRWFGVPLTFFTIILINALFLSDSVSDFWEMLGNAHSLPAPMNLPVNYKMAGFGIVALVCFFALEKIYEWLDAKRDTPAAVACRFLVSTGLIFVGYIFTANLKDFVYLGF